MTKLTNAEKDKLDNTCGNLRVTKLGTHVKSLEDFVNEMQLATQADTVAEAINELYHMFVNKDCSSIQIPPPGFFTLWGNDEDGKLYCYYNDKDHPPVFQHIEDDSSDLNGTLYLYIADPSGDNHYRLEVGQYIAVRHLNDYYTKTECDGKYPVTVEKQATATAGYAATYVVKQNGVQVGAKINIPKDFFLKNGSVKTCTTANVPVTGYKVGDIYLDMEINVNDGTETSKHMYILVKDLADVYTADEVSITLSNNNVFSIKDLGVSTAKLADNSVTTAKIKDGNVTNDKLATAVKNAISEKATIGYVDQQIANIEDDITVDFASKADVNHTHGNLSNDGKVGTAANKPLITGNNGIVQAGSFGTGANTFCQGNDSRLSDSRNPKFTTIGASSTNPKDLNDYTTGGFYFCSNDATMAPYISNCPKTGTNNNSFFLLVETWNATIYVKQTLTYYNNSQKTYIRTKQNTGGWSPWHLVKTTEETIQSTHTTSTSAWTGKSNHLISLEAGTVIYYWLMQQPTTDNVTLDLTLANGDTTGAKNVYFGNSVRLTNQFRVWSIIGLYWDGYNWFVINPYTDTTYTPASNAPLPSKYNASVGSSVKYAREDHVHPLFDYLDGGTSGSAGYTKIIQIKVNGTYQDTPIKVDIAQRRFREQQTINIEFATGSTTDPTVASLTHDGSNNDIYMYKESTSTWSLIVKKLDPYDTIRIKVNNPNNAIAVSNLNTHVSSLPTSTTANPLVKSNNVVSNSLTDSSTVNALSANQGKLLNDNKAPNNHASTGTTYGASSASNYGHSMASSTSPKAPGTANVGSETAKFARGDHVHPLQSSTTSTLSLVNAQAMSGTVKCTESNGWGVVYFEALKCTTTTTGYTPFAELPHATEATIYANLNLDATGTNAILLRVKGNYLEGKILTANQRMYGHIIYPVAV